MPAPQQPQREISSAPRCDKPVQGDGVMSYHCSLPQGHEIQTSDPADPQPCYTVESSRTARVWRNWAQREYDRKDAPTGTVIQCPTCSEPAMRVTEAGGRCENCGATAEIQQDISAATYIGEPMLADDGVVAAAQHDTTERDADIIAAAKAAAPPRLEDGCLGEHDPATNLRCSMRPAPPAGYDLVEVGPQPLRAEQVPDWLLVADGSPNPTAEQVKVLKDLRDEFIADGSDPDTGYRIHFDNDESRVERYSISEETQVLRERIHAEPSAPTKQREGDQTLPSGDESIPDDQSLVIDDMEARRKVGVTRYGQGHRPFNGRNTLLDAYEEMLDGAVYVRSLLRARAATQGDLIEALAHFLDTAGPDGQPIADSASRLHMSLSELAVRISERVTDFVTLRIEEARAAIEEAEDAKTPARQQVALAIRQALGSGPHKMDEDGSWISMTYVLDVLDEVSRTQPEVTLDPEPMLPPVSLQHLLALVEDEFPQDLPSVDAIVEWPEEVRYEAQQWATAVHLVASDNYDVTIPEMPEVLR